LATAKISVEDRVRISVLNFAEQQVIEAQACLEQALGCLKEHGTPAAVEAVEIALNCVRVAKVKSHALTRSVENSVKE
jgi:hypothetical protein